MKLFRELSSLNSIHKLSMFNSLKHFQKTNVLPFLPIFDRYFTYPDTY